MSILLVLLILGLAVEPHLRKKSPSQLSLRIALALFLTGDIVQRLAMKKLNLAPEGTAPFGIAMLDLVAGLVAWAGLSRLLACDARRRDKIVRAVFAVLALATAAGSIQVSAICATMALFSFRWTRRFSTRPLLGMAIGFCFVLVAGFGVGAPDEKLYAESTQPILAASRWLVMVTRFYVFFGVFALFRAFLRDPSLGIKTVGRRLALSHVLVVLVPLVLVGTLWSFTTVLGVNADRAMVAARAIEREGQELGNVLDDALARGAGAVPLVRDRIAGHGHRWRDARLWMRERGTWRRAIGDSVPNEARLEHWLDSLRTLPRAGIVSVTDANHYAVARLDPADSTRGAVLLVQADSLIQGGPARVAGASLAFMVRDLIARGGSITQMESGDAMSRIPKDVPIRRSDSLRFERTSASCGRSASRTRPCWSRGGAVSRSRSNRPAKTVRGSPRPGAAWRPCSSRATRSCPGSRGPERAGARRAR